MKKLKLKILKDVKKYTLNPIETIYPFYPITMEQLIYEDLCYKSELLPSDEIFEQIKKLELSFTAKNNE